VNDPAGAASASAVAFRSNRTQQLGRVVDDAETGFYHGDLFRRTGPRRSYVNEQLLATVPVTMAHPAKFVV
jgi:hypothetical protein